MDDQELSPEAALSILLKTRTHPVEAAEEWISHECLIALKAAGSKGLTTFDIEKLVTARMERGIHMPVFYARGLANEKQRLIRRAIWLLRDQNRAEHKFGHDGYWCFVGILDTIAREAARES